jgi:hypothetical protein
MRKSRTKASYRRRPTEEMLPDVLWVLGGLTGLYLLTLAWRAIF